MCQNSGFSLSPLFLIGVFEIFYLIVGFFIFQHFSCKKMCQVRSYWKDFGVMQFLDPTFLVERAFFSAFDCILMGFM